MEKFINTLKPIDKLAIKYCTDSEKTEQGYLNEHFLILGMVKNHNEKPMLDFYRGNSGCVLNDISDARFSKNEDIYISKNPLKTKVVSPEIRKRIKEKGLSAALYSTGMKPGAYDGYTITNCENNVIGLKNIVIDIDCHYDLTPDEWENIRTAFVNALDDIKEYIPTPTIINFTGRGFHFWFSIHEVSKQLGFIYKLVCEELCNKLEIAIKECLPFETDNFSIDRAASKNIAGLIRMPGTNNSKASLDSKIIEFTKNKYDLNELKDMLNISIKSKPNKKRNFCKKKFISLPKKRLEIIKDAVVHNMRNVSEGCRHNYCFMYYNCLKQLVSEKKAVLGLYEFNNKFRNPLSESELKSIIRSISRLNLGFYKYTNKRFSEMLGLDESEIINYRLVKSHSSYKNKLKEKRMLYKLNRNKKVLDIYAATGSIKEACKAGVCENTARKIIKENSNMLATLKRRIISVRNRKVFNNFLNSNSIKKAAYVGNCCVVTAKKIIDTYVELRKNIVNLIEQKKIIIDEIFYYRMRNHHDKLYKNDYNYLEKKVQEITGLNKEDINIAIAPYIRLA